MLKFEIDKFKRHIDETIPLIEQLSDEFIEKDVVANGRTIGEIVLHMIRSFEYYTIGLSGNIWKAAPYNLEANNKAEKIKELFKKVSGDSLNRLQSLQESDLFQELTFNRKATKLEIIQEMLEHSITHRGQLLVYYRIVGLTPAKINYII